MKPMNTIVAVATPPGRGGVGIVRISGPHVAEMMPALLGRALVPRHACYGDFLDEAGEVIDQGVAIYFQAPNSFTGEEVLELQGHGGPIIVDLLIKRALSLGARLARPGEFSEQAFLNDKMDLTQAEAVADLINAESAQAARSAVRSLQGAFSEKIHALVASVTKLRMFVEAAIDFPDEEIDFIKDSHVVSDAENILGSLKQVLAAAGQGVLLHEGIRVVIAGPPNAGKSSLLNALSGTESAIVTDIAGTTRDVLKEKIVMDGLPLHIVDTAGIRETTDIVEQEGVKRARAALASADLVLAIFDVCDERPLEKQLSEVLPQDCNQVPCIIVQNKIDLSGTSPSAKNIASQRVVQLSVKEGLGLSILKEKIKDSVGFGQQAEGEFTARRRHLDALEAAHSHVVQGLKALKEAAAGELLAEELRLAQVALSEITGEFSSEDLLGEIFSSFCIGK